MVPDRRIVAGLESWVREFTMARRRSHAPLPIIWRVPDALWAIIAPILPELDLPARTGRPRIDARAALDGDPRRLGDDRSSDFVPSATGTIYRLSSLTKVWCVDVAVVRNEQ
jgi:hypothetical protein